MECCPTHAHTKKNSLIGGEVIIPQKNKLHFQKNYVDTDENGKKVGFVDFQIQKKVVG